MSDNSELAKRLELLIDDYPSGGKHDREACALIREVQHVLTAPSASALPELAKLISGPKESFGDDMESLREAHEYLSERMLECGPIETPEDYSAEDYYSRMVCAVERAMKLLECARRWLASASQGQPVAWKYEMGGQTFLVNQDPSNWSDSQPFNQKFRPTNIIPLYASPPNAGTQGQAVAWQWRHKNRDGSWTSWTNIDEHVFNEPCAPDEEVRALCVFQPNAGTDAARDATPSDQARDAERLRDAIEFALADAVDGQIRNVGFNKLRAAIAAERGEKS